MTKLPTRVCTACGRGFTTAHAAQRHIINVERGNGYVATEADYRTGLITGIIPPPVPKSLRPTYKKKEESFQDMVQREFNVGYWREMGRITAYRFMQSSKVDLSMWGNFVYGMNIESHQGNNKTPVNRPPQDAKESEKSSYPQSDLTEHFKDKFRDMPQDLISYNESLDRQIVAEALKLIAHVTPNHASDQVLAQSNNTSRGDIVDKRPGDSAGEINTGKVTAQASPQPDNKAQRKKAIDLSEEQVNQDTVDTKQNTEKTSSS